MEERNGTTRAERAMADYAQFYDVTTKLYDVTTPVPLDVPILKKSAFGGNFGRRIENSLKNRQTRHIQDVQENLQISKKVF